MEKKKENKLMILGHIFIIGFSFMFIGGAVMYFKTLAGLIDEALISYFLFVGGLTIVVLDYFLKMIIHAIIEINNIFKRR